MSIYRFLQNYEWLIIEGQKHGQVITIGITPVQEELLTPIPWFKDHSHYQSERDRYDCEIGRLSKKLSVLFVSMTDVFGANLKSYLIDGIHPNAEGHRLIFERVKSVLEKEGVL